MKRTIVNIALTLAPALVAAQQASTTTQASASAGVTAQTPRTSSTVNGNAQASSASSASSAPSNYTAENRAKIDASFEAARKRDLPQQPIRDRIAEGQARGASGAQVIRAARHAETRLEAGQDAMIRAGRKPSQSDVSSGYQAMAHGATSAQVETVARRTPPNRSLVVTLDALARLEAQGMSPDRAEAAVVSSLNANASDQALGQPTAATARSGSAQPGSVGATGAITGTAGSTTAAGSSATAGVTGAVGAVIKRPPTE